MPSTLTSVRCFLDCHIDIGCGYWNGGSGCRWVVVGVVTGWCHGWIGIIVIVVVGIVPEVVVRGRWVVVVGVVVVGVWVVEIGGHADVLWRLCFDYYNIGVISEGIGAAHDADDEEDFVGAVAEAADHDDEVDGLCIVIEAVFEGVGEVVEGVAAELVAAVDGCAEVEADGAVVLVECVLFVDVEAEEDEGGCEHDGGVDEGAA